MKLERNENLMKSVVGGREKRKRKRSISFILFVVTFMFWNNILESSLLHNLMCFLLVEEGGKGKGKERRERRGKERGERKVKGKEEGRIVNCFGFAVFPQTKSNIF